jgi:radical SAM superfamily enzyme YgiQ (UPF0313 family)
MPLQLERAKKPFYSQVKHIVNTVRRFNSEIKIVLGGGLITSMPESMLKDLKPDFISIGEGEITILELMNAIKNRQDFKNIKGIGFIDENNQIIITSERPPIKNLDILPFPDFDGFEIDKFLSIQRNIDSFFLLKIFQGLCQLSQVEDVHIGVHFAFILLVRNIEVEV